MDMPYTQRLDGGAKYQAPQALQPVTPQLARPASAQLIAPQGALPQQNVAQNAMAAQHEAVAPVTGLVKNALERGSGEAIQHLISKGMRPEEASVAVAKAMENPDYEFRPNNPSTIVALERTAKNALGSGDGNTITKNLRWHGVVGDKAKGKGEEKEGWGHKIVGALFPTGDDAGYSGPATEALKEARRRPGYDKSLEGHPVKAVLTDVAKANGVDINNPEEIKTPLADKDFVKVTTPDGKHKVIDKKNLAPEEKVDLQQKAAKGEVKLAPVPKAEMPPEVESQAGLEEGVKGVLDDHSTWNNSMDILSKSLFNYAIGYAQSGGDQLKAAGAAIQGGVGQWDINKRKPKVPQLQQAGLTDAQIDRYVQTGALSAQSEAQLAKFTEAQRLSNGGTGAAGKGPKIDERTMRMKSTLRGAKSFDAENQRITKKFGEDVDSIIGKTSNTNLAVLLEDDVKSSLWKDISSKTGNNDSVQAVRAAKSFIEGPLRTATGAVIGSDEMATYVERFFPRSDDPQEIENKRELRAQVRADMEEMLASQGWKNASKEEKKAMYEGLLAGY